MLLYLLLNVLEQEGRRSQVVHRDVEEALNLFLVEVHGDQVGEACTQTHLKRLYEGEDAVDERLISPALHIMEAISLETMDPLFLILHCLL